MSQISPKIVFEAGKKKEEVWQVMEEDADPLFVSKKLKELVYLLEGSGLERDYYEELEDYAENISGGMDFDVRQAIEKITGFENDIISRLEHLPSLPMGEDGELRNENFVSPLSEFGEEERARIATRDIEAGSEALLNGLYTSSGFMFLRSLEDLLRELYRREKRQDPRDRTWGMLLSELEDHYVEMGVEERREADLEALHSNLSILREKRNKIAHPPCRYLNRGESENIFREVTRTAQNILQRLDSSS